MGREVSPREHESTGSPLGDLGAYIYPRWREAQSLLLLPKVDMSKHEGMDVLVPSPLAVVALGTAHHPSFPPDGG